MFWSKFLPGACVLAFCLLLSAPLTALPGDYTIELGIGNSVFKGNLWTYVPENLTLDQESGGFGLRFRQAVEVYSGVSIGLSIDYLQIEDRLIRMGLFDVPLTAQAIPIMVSYRQYSGKLFIQAELGLSGWNGDKGGFSPAGSFGGGYTLPLGSWLNLTFSARLIVLLADKLILPVQVGSGMEIVL